MATASLAIGVAHALSAFIASRHAGQPAPGPVEPAWLHVAGQIAGVALMIELLIALLIVAALMFGLAYGMWWLSQNVVPVIGDYSEQAQRYVEIAERSSDRVAHGVASFHGARAGIAAGLRAFFLPGHGQRRPAPATRPLSPLRPLTHPAVSAVPPTPSRTTLPSDEPISDPNPTPALPHMPNARAMTSASTAERGNRPSTPLIAATPRVAGRALGVVAGRVAGA